MQQIPSGQRGEERDRGSEISRRVSTCLTSGAGCTALHHSLSRRSFIASYPPCDTWLCDVTSIFDFKKQQSDSFVSENRENCKIVWREAITHEQFLDQDQNLMSSRYEPWWIICFFQRIALTCKHSKIISMIFSEKIYFILDTDLNKSSQ